MADEKPKPTGTELLSKCDGWVADGRWKLLRESDHHRLYRTASGSWVVVPKQEQQLSSLFMRHFAQIIYLEMRKLMGEAKLLVRKGEVLHRAGVIFIVCGLASVSWTFYKALSEPRPTTKLTPSVAIGMILFVGLLAVAAIWFGKNIAGPRLTKIQDPGDRPFQRLEFEPAEKPGENS